MVRDKPVIRDVLPNFLEFIKGTVLIAHNIRFDSSFLLSALEACCMKTENFLCIDTIPLAKKCFPGYPSYSLGNICRNLNITIENAHRAEDDAIACMNLFSKCIMKLPNSMDMDIETLFIKTEMKYKKLYDAKKGRY